ncbi:TonB-dependent receptor domain-containing protein [Sandarakinorhabdus sp. DWP1-3-1]|uniref:TonB-dependent receptor domain-containing protein n=1 Tax=Sandarakinorhabdus sp. DWP1-3-1 TaxID=2804627 RepID=UPI003CF01B1A
MGTMMQATGVVTKRRSLGKHFLLASAIVGLPGAALAQATPPPPAETGAAPGEDAAIIVTGSRLSRAGLEGTSPIVALSGEALVAQGQTTLEAGLNQLPQLQPSTTSSSNQSGGAGVLSADLRGLGPVRTLVLVDGRRFIPADFSGLTDLATIPDLMLDRVDVITGGASAIYGSDAIAGAVNFVLKRDFDGLQGQYTFGETDRGDGRSHKIDVMIGANSADGRGNVTGYFSYTKRDAVLMGDREFSALPLLADATGKFQPFGSGNIPGGAIALNSQQLAQIQGVPDLNNASGACNTGNAGIRFTEPGGRPEPFCRLRDQFNYAAPNFLLRPLERYQAAVTAHYEITDGVEAYGQFFYTRKENSFQQAAEAVNPSSSGQAAGTVLIPNATTNPLFSQAQRDFFSANAAFFDPDGDGTYTVRGYGRRFEEFGPRTVNYVTTSFNVTGGLRGDFDIGGNKWKWDTFFQFQQADENNRRLNLLSRSRTTAGLDVVLVNGVPQCRNREIPGCVPVNIFGTDTLTPAMAEFLSVDTTTTSQFKRTVAGGSISGDAFALPAGNVATAFGVEYRRDSFNIRPDEVALSNDLAAVSVPPIVNSGNYDLFELFGEVRVPILADVPGFKTLAVEAAGRYAKYSTIGGVFTWRGAVDWEVTDWVRLRGNYSRAIRAPNLSELYAPTSQGFIGGRDPCLAVNAPTQQQKELCVAQGVPRQFVDTLTVGASQGFNTESGGNLLLEEETADTLTLGAVFSPARGLALTVDYYDIKVKGAISQLGAQVLIDTCFNTLAAASVSCQAINRDTFSGNISFVRAPLLNVAERRVQGLDVGASYSFDLPSAVSISGDGARLGLQANVSWQFKNTTIAAEGLPTIDCAGYYGGACSSDSTRISPDLRAFVGIDYTSGGVSLRNQLRYIGSLDLLPGAPPSESGTLGAETYWDISARWNFVENFTVFGGINNVLDNQPPVMGFAAGGDSNTNPQLYDVIGRQYFVGVGVKF